MYKIIKTHSHILYFSHNLIMRLNIIYLIIYFDYFSMNSFIFNAFFYKIIIITKIPIWFQIFIFFIYLHSFNSMIFRLKDEKNIMDIPLCENIQIWEIVFFYWVKLKTLYISCTFVQILYIRFLMIICQLRYNF